MRDSVPHLPRFRFALPRFTSFRSFAPLAPLASLVALGSALAGCSGESKGQLILALQTDMSMPEDITRVKIEVKTDGVSRYDRTFVVDPTQEGHEKIPATLSVVAGEKEHETVELKVIGLRPGSGSNGLDPRTLNKTITTIPSERIALLRVPMQWLCNDKAEDIGDGEYESLCEPANGKETSCRAGSCEDVHVDESNLPEFQAEAVFGGSDDPGASGTCFPTEECFDAGEDVTPDADCVVSYEPESDEIINFAILAMNGGIGRCREGTLPCYVGLDQSPDFGWFELDEDEAPAGAGRRFQLPQGVCDRLALDDADPHKAVGVRVSTADACEITKTPRYPTCGPWSSVGAPSTPTGSDRDLDGFEAPEDCDDDNNQVYPRAPELCDELDNDCNDDIDDSCSTVVPDSHPVDFSALDGFTSTENYAIYQAFDDMSPLDLDQHTVTFTPGPEGTHYLVATGDLEWDPDATDLVPITTGEDPSNCDDCYTNLPLDFTFNFYGVEYTSVFPSSNGYLTFGVGDETFVPSVTAFLANAPRISAFWDDLDTSGPEGTIDDTISYFSSSTKLVVTYENIQIFPTSGTSNTFQFVLFEDGTIKISYDGMADLVEESLAGITPGSISGTEPCPTGFTLCSGTCTDLNSNPIHCGECNYSCGADESCANGTCLAGEVPCSSVSQPCEGRCVGYCDFQTADTCSGACYGTCNGTCSMDDGAGGCAGTCDGTCQGQCLLSGGGQCDQNCNGTCYLPEGSTCPTPPSALPCSFVQSTIDDPMNCADTAQDAAGTVYQLSCYLDTCECCVNGNCTPTSATPATLCSSASALRSELVAECMQSSACGDSCPATTPATGDDCDETQIAYCSYADSSYCICQAAQYQCMGGT